MSAWAEVEARFFGVSDLTEDEKQTVGLLDSEYPHHLRVYAGKADGDHLFVSNSCRDWDPEDWESYETPGKMEPGCERRVIAWFLGVAERATSADLYVSPSRDEHEHIRVRKLEDGTIERSRLVWERVDLDG